jgi:hypothetical protein
MVATRTITLPHGVLTEGDPDRTVELRAPIGADEWHLLEQRGHRSDAEAASELLERCITQVGGGPPSRRAVRALTVGDREALMLHLRAAAFGERLACTLDCPHCSSRMDPNLTVEQLLCAPYEEVRESYEATLGSSQDRCRMRFRLPTGADQEAVAGESDVEVGVRLLAERCVEEVRVRGRAASAVPTGVLAELSAAMAQLDPQAEISLRARCPECEVSFVGLLDASALLLSELTGSLDRLLHEVHAIALRYHWSEQEILALDLRRRRRYLELLVDEEGVGGLP